MSITGVHNPSRPPSARVDGWSTLVGQTLMHWSHLIQRSRNSDSSTEPGGRIAFLLNAVGLTAADNRRNGYASTPATAVNNTRRRLTAGQATSVSGTWLMTGRLNSLPSFGKYFFGGMNRNRNASSGQSSMQLKQTKHSLLRSAACGSDAPSQWLTHRSQSVQRVRSRSIRHQANRDNTPRNAPSGQSTRQKNRGMTRFIPTRPSITRPTNQAPKKIRCSGLPGENENACNQFAPSPRVSSVWLAWSTPRSTAGATAAVNVRYMIQIGSSNPICNAPNAANTRNMIRMMYFRPKIGR